MSGNFSTSTNIVRDLNRDINYIPTPNAKKIFNQLVHDLNSGIRTFNIIGSYGTGKSSFLWAFEKNLLERKPYFAELNGQFNDIQDFHFINIVGAYTSLGEVLAEQIKVKSTNDETILLGLEKLYARLAKKGKYLCLIVDEFGKFLEHAAKNNPEKELYFIQQLAEFVNDKDRNILLITTLHQSFSGYSSALNREQRREWEKVKGRIKELAFNEPVEQLLYLAAQKISVDQHKITDKKGFTALTAAINKSNLLPLSNKLETDLTKALYPLDVLSASFLTLSLQRYGQNERSLFTFFASNEFGNMDEGTGTIYDIAHVYDYLLENFFSLLSTKYNHDYTQWAAIKTGVEKIESRLNDHVTEAIRLVKTIGLTNIFASGSGKADYDFYVSYGQYALGIENVEEVLKKLEDKGIIKYVNYKSQFILANGTDLDFELAITDASTKVDNITDIVSRLEGHFEFHYTAAKSIQLELGTPRYFEYKISTEPINLRPEGAVDGYINLVFSEGLNGSAIKKHSAAHKEAILYACFEDTKEIKNILYEIDKIQYVIANNLEDVVAIRELKNIKQQEIEKLNDKVLNKLFNSNEVHWFYKGGQPTIRSKTDFNKQLSLICMDRYSSTPVFKNEMVNKHKFTPVISTARKNLFNQLVNHWDEIDIGFDEHSFPPEKAIYLTLLKRTGIHKEIKGEYILGEPDDKSFAGLWERSVKLLDDAKSGKKPITEFFDVLGERPLKLKAGFINIWLPLFLFIKREEYALFDGHGSFIPYLTPEIFDLIFRSPKDFRIKTFNVQGVNLDLFKKYRELVNQRNDSTVGTTSFIETIKPFLSFYKQLPSYSKKTKKISEGAFKLRDKIANSKDPEKSFFEEFPAALGYHSLKLNENQAELEEFVKQLHNAIREIRTAYDDLITRVEIMLLKGFGFKPIEFSKYKKKIAERYKGLNKDILPAHQKTFYSRLVSPLDDRNSWINSVVGALIEKTLENTLDSEEALIEKRLSSYILELDNLKILQREDTVADEVLIKFDYTSTKEGMTQERLILAENQQNLVSKRQKELKKYLDKDSKINMAALFNLLKDQIESSRKKG